MRGDSARPGKRPLRALSASEKMEAIQRVHEGESKASVARDIGVPESTLRGWCKSEHKIRGMARNSSTPDSEVHSPASSSGTNNINPGNIPAGGSANVSSEDESPCAKRPKLDQQTSMTATGSSAFLTNDICLDMNDGKQSQHQPDNKHKIDYVGLMTSMANMRPENSSLLLQQLGLLSGATGSLAKNLLGMTAAGLSHGSTVGLVENGLQYTKSTATNMLAGCNGGVGVISGGLSGVSSNNSGKRHSISAIAPAQMDSVAKSCTRKILPPAAEAPSTPVPASPRKTNDNVGSSGSGICGISVQQRTKVKKENVTTGPGICGSSSTASNNKRIDDALWLWLTQQQQLLGQQSATFNPSINQQDGSWFWQWYKQCSFPLLASTQTPTPIAANNTAPRRSPSRAKALLDNVLSHNSHHHHNNNNNNNNNNNDLEKARRGFNHEEEGIDSVAEDVPRSSEEAIEHAEKFLRWLDRCSEPSVTRLQVLQFKYLLDKLKACRKKSPSLKHSRK
ncbi:protein distal antenna-like [Vespa crabro]|uniref:protein distal antenna-like n=1 Tax=Vespa crabro TaxID=7445 RepID=UPI001F01F4D1|nr:protein distal antenna-like [Vespa crabro]